MIIPHEELELETLNNIIRENILREVLSTDYDISKDVDKVRNNIISGELSLVYSKINNNVTIVKSEILNKKSR